MPQQISKTIECFLDIRNTFIRRDPSLDAVIPTNQRFCPFCLSGGDIILKLGKKVNSSLFSASVTSTGRRVSSSKKLPVPGE